MTTDGAPADGGGAPRSSDSTPGRVTGALRTAPATARRFGREVAERAGWTGDGGWKRGLGFGLLLALIVGVSFVVVPRAAEADVGDFTSDDFNGVALDTNRWTIVNPAGDGAVGISGQVTTSSQLVLAVPGGESHDAWTTNDSLRAMQRVADRDLDIQAKFESTPSAKYQMQGLQVAEDGGEYIRYGVQHTGEALRLYAASVHEPTPTVRLDIPVAPGAAAVLRVQRAGDRFTLLYSADGLTWTTATSFTQDIDVSDAGVFAGNHADDGGTPPAFNALVDYAFNTAEPIVPEDAPITPPDGDETPPVIDDVAVDPSATAAVVTWATDEPASSAVEYGPTEGLGSSVSGTGLDNRHTVTITGLTPATTYHVSARSQNAAGLTSSSATTTFTTDPAPATANFVSDDFRSGLSEGLWTVVDPVGDGAVETEGVDECAAQVALAVPGGDPHDPWVENRALRLMQPVGNTDLDVVAGFASMPGTKFQSQGVIVQQSDTVYFRYGVHNDGSNTRLYAATFGGDGAGITRLDQVVDPEAAQALRVVRHGDSWTLYHSADGDSWARATTFAQPMSLTSAGVFAGNNATGNASPPEYTALVDYVFDNNNPLSPEDGGDTCEAHPLSTGVAGSGAVTRSPNAAAYAPGTTSTLTAVPAPGWQFAGWEGDVAGAGNPARLTMSAARQARAVFTPDMSAPVISGVEVTTTASSATVRWTTDDPSLASVSYGLSAGYENGAQSGGAVARTEHMVTLTGLTSETEYHYRVTATNGAEQATSTVDTAIFTSDSTAPRVLMFYGDNQTFGRNGQTQRWANILGNASDEDGVRSLSYRLNGGPIRNLKMGGDLRRIYYPGDFNIELDYEELNVGDNTVVITAVDHTGETTVKAVEVTRVRVDPPGLPYTVDWSQVTTVNERAQVVDGKWAIQPNGTVRAVEPAYDRTITLGDISWTDYEVTVPVTVHSLVDGYGTAQSGAPLVGIGMRWNGHTLIRNEQPRTLWYPTGAFAWFRWQQGGRYELIGNYDDPIVRFFEPAMNFGTQYVFKARAETVPGGTQYSYKVWVAGSAEPAGWQQTILEPDGPESGAVLLVSHHTVADWGNVTVTPLT